MGVRERLPSSLISLLEERVSGRGDLNMLAVVPLPGTGAGVRPIQRQVVLEGRSFDTHAYGRREQLKTTRNFSVRGIAVDDVLALSDSPVRLLENAEAVAKPVKDPLCAISGRDASGSGLAVSTGDRTYRVCSGAHLGVLEDQVLGDETNAVAAVYENRGAKRALLMLVDFSDRPGEPVSAATARNTMTGVAGFFRSNSFEQMYFADIAVTPVLRMPWTSTQYSRAGDFSSLLQHARNAAAAAGFQNASYQFDVVAFANMGFNWSGLGYMGGKGAWVQGSLPRGTLAHELGHNAGLWHAGFWNSSTGIGGGSREEYGNIFDVMGNSSSFPAGHFSANFKFNLGWLTDANIHRAAGEGNFRIYAMDAGGPLRADRRYAVRIPAGVQVLGLSLDYWLDYRQALLGSNLGVDGTVVQWGNDLGAEKASLLIDTTPGSTSGKLDSPIAVAHTFADVTRNLTISVTGRGGVGVDAFVDVSIGSPPPPISILDALDLPGATWTSDGSALWAGQTASTHDGIDAAQSGNVADNQQSWLETRITGSGTLSFWWKVSSEANFDYLRVLVDGAEAGKISGAVDWQRRELVLATGTHTIRWNYTKDVSVSSGSDRGWLDQVNFIAAPLANVVYVDWRNTSQNPDGTLARPFPTVAQGVAAVANGGTVNVRAGTYAYPSQLFSKPLRLTSYDGHAVINPTGRVGTPVGLLQVGQLKPTARSADGAIGFQFASTPEVRYQVLTSTNLVDWSVWKDFTAEEDVAEFTAPDPASEAMRFFKVVAP